MNCSCIDYGDDWGPECFSSADRRARKEHLCCECRRVIAPGETYRYESGIWDGRPEAFKICADCMTLRAAFFCSWAYGGLWRDMASFVWATDGIGVLDKVADLTAPARDRVLEMIENLWAEKAQGF